MAFSHTDQRRIQITTKTHTIDKKKKKLIAARVNLTALLSKKNTVYNKNDNTTHGVLVMFLLFFVNSFNKKPPTPKPPLYPD